MPSLRIDRVLTLAVFRRLALFAAEPEKRNLPILMYHSISGDAEEGIHPYYRVATSPQRFAEQMNWLEEMGYLGTSLRQALKMMAAGGTGTVRPVVVTFDDGFRDFLTEAWPVLASHHFTATMYLPTGFISMPRKSFRGKECLNWQEVRELHTRGVQFGSHTVSHPKLYELSWNDIEEELRLSKQHLEREIGEQADSFCYPYAFPQEDAQFSERLVELQRRLGYQNCVTTVVGCHSDGNTSFLLKRLPVNSEDDRQLLAAKLEGAYNWVETAQSTYRRLRRIVPIISRRVRTTKVSSILTTRT
jgi:peptidoglycan/xylan/chitin deacetylase (PgdA/CDA1 family)